MVLVAALGGYQVLDMNPSQKANMVRSSSQSQQAELFAKNKDCSGFRSTLEEKLTSDENITSLFYSPKTSSCLYEKRTRTPEGVTEELINIFTKEKIASWSSFNTSQKREDYLSLLSSYQN